MTRFAVIATSVAPHQFAETLKKSRLPVPRCDILAAIESNQK